MNLRIGYQIAKKTLVGLDCKTATPKKIFEVTGDVEVTVFGRITDTFLSAAGNMTLEAGITGNTAALIAQTAVAALLTDLMWATNTPANPLATPSPKLLANGEDIYVKTGTANSDEDAGEATMFCLWRALSADGKVKAA